MSGKHVLEIGAGTALASMAASVAGAAGVLITDRPDEEVTARTVRKTMTLNNTTRCTMVCTP